MAPFFTSALFSFLRDLEANNDRGWFKANQERYERTVREPALEFVSALAPRLRKVSPSIVADPRPVGGSLFRIQRDTRFSKDKSPYKTYVGLRFGHERGRDVHAPGYYLHLAPGECYFGMGIWHPDTGTARTIRQAIAEDPGSWKKAAHGSRFARRFELSGDSLQRVPKEYEADHPFADDLRRKDFIAGTSLTQKQVTSHGFVDEFTGLCREGAPMVRFLCEALGLPF
jgi:uncharacterized protein (TIGR02453 family)